MHASSFTANYFLKVSTLKNLFKKATGKKLSSWTYKTINVTVDFKGERFSVILPKGYDYNIYLNPYFHEYDVTKFVVNNIGPGEVFLDVGAHAGLYTLLASKKNAETYSFEPNPLNLQYLKENIELNNQKNITIVSKAVSNESGSFLLHFSKRETASSSGVWQNDREENVCVESITLDQAASIYGWKDIKILKIDTEGNDLKVLEGAAETLKKCKYIIIEDNSEAAKRFLANRNFIVKKFEPSGYLLAEKSQR